MPNENKLSHVLRTYSLLDCEVLSKLSLSLWKTFRKYSAFSTCAFLICAGRSNVQAYTTVLISTAASSTLETQFLASTTNQYLGTITSNPFASNTYTLKLFGPNPSYNPPPTTLEQALSLGSTVYAYGFAAGQNYDQKVQVNLVNSFSLNCSTPMANVPSWDPATCQAITGAIINDLYQESLSTPTVIPGF